MALGDLVKDWVHFTVCEGRYGGADRENIFPSSVIWRQPSSQVRIGTVQSKEIKRLIGVSTRKSCCPPAFLSFIRSPETYGKWVTDRITEIVRLDGA